jgi:hypothetical protein
MAKFTNCLQIVNAMPEQDQDALLARLDELQARGMSPKEAQLQAAIDVLAQVEREGGMRKSASREAQSPSADVRLSGKVDGMPEYRLTLGGVEAVLLLRRGVVEILDINSKSRGQGEGRRALVEIENFAREKGAKRVILDSVPSAIPFWENSGFSQAKTRSDFRGGARFTKDVAPGAAGIRKSSDRVTDTPEFKRWFGDSKVVNDEGKPLVVYHGSTTGGITNATVQNSFFSADPQVASTYALDLDAGRAGDEAIVNPVYIRIENPLIIDAQGAPWMRIPFEGKTETTDGIASIAKKRGHDGVIIKSLEDNVNDEELPPSDIYITLGKRGQIKSAIGNNGQFDPANPDIRKSPERDANFKRWSGGAPVIKLGDDHGFRSGQPVVVEALHGTTNADLTEFKRSRANIESDMGAGFYASNTPEDVAANYANNEGPDLTSRIERATERLADSMEDDDQLASELIAEYLRDTGSDIELTDDNLEELKEDYIGRAADNASRKRLSEGAPNTMKLFMRFKNPAVFGGLGETFLDFNEDFNEETDEYGEASGLLLDFAEALREVAPEYNASDREIESAIGKLFEQAEGEGIKVSEALNAIKSELVDAFDDEGNNATNEVFRQALSRIGFDGVIDTTVYGKFGPRVIKGAYTQVPTAGMSGMTPDTVHFIAFEPEQIKSVTGNSGEFGENRNILKSVDRPQFYSQLQRAIEGVPDRLSNMGALGWKQWIDSNGPKLGVKKEEIEWSGIKDYLDLQGKKKLSKDDLSAYLDDSGVQISEVVLGRAYNPDGSEKWDYQGEAKYDQYTLPGGEDYRELLITLDGGVSGKELAALDERIQELEDDRDGADEDERDAIDQRIFAVQAERKKLLGNGYRSSHWDKPNVLAHIRINDRVAQAPGFVVRNTKSGNRSEVFATREQAEAYQAKLPASLKTEITKESRDVRVLFVEEVQSDWGQDGKKAGFGRQLRDGWSLKTLENGTVSVYGPGMSSPYGTTDFGDKDAEASAFKIADTYGGMKTSTVPSAPFVTKTEGWLNLALKRIAMMAVEGGYDKVAFVNGEQSADRYDLSKQIQSIAYSPKEKLLDAWDHNRSKVMRREITDESQIEDYVGKEVAQRLLATKPVMGKHLLDGEDIKVGGEGMKTFYDQIVPQALNKLLPKIGGEKLGKVDIGSQGDAWGVFDATDEENAGLYSRHATRAEADAAAAEFDGGVEVRRVTDATTQPGFDVTDKMRETVSQGLPLFSRDRQAPDTPEFKKWFGKSVVVDKSGKPLVVYRGEHGEDNGRMQTKLGSITFSSSEVASDYALEPNDSRMTPVASRVIPAYLSIQKPVIYEPGGDPFTYVTDLIKNLGYDTAMKFVRKYEERLGEGAWENDPEMEGSLNEIAANQPEKLKNLYIQAYPLLDDPEFVAAAKAAGFDGAVHGGSGISSDTEYRVFDETQIKSATGNNGDFDGSNPDIRKSADRPWFEDLSKFKVSTNYQLGDLLKSSKKLSWWDRTVGTQYNLAQKQPEFKRVFDAVQTFINDVSSYATRAADLAPTILPKLDGLADINPFSKNFKRPMSAEDMVALRDPVFGGTLKYARDENGKIYEEDDVQKAGVVFSDEELRSMFSLSDAQIGLYRQFRKSVDQSVTDLALSDMVRYLGEDGRDIAEAVMASGNVDVAVGIIESHLADLAKSTPQRADVMNSTAEVIQKIADQTNNLMSRGYAPLSRYGEYTVYVVGPTGKQEYFGMFESKADMNRMAREMAEQYPDAEVSTGTMSQESYKLFSGVTPETLALFGDQLGLEESGIDAKSEAFQVMLKVAKTNRSAMKRLIERKGIDGYSEDAGRVLAGFVYSNARQISTNLHAGEIGKAAADVKDGDVKDAAIRLMEYIQNPQEEAQAIRGLMFTQFIGGSIASALVNMTQPFTMTAPYLSQFDGVTGAAKRMADAMNLVRKGVRNDADLKDALKRAEDLGIVSPQEVHQLMAQARGKGSLITGDGTKVGDAAAKANNFTAKLGLAWGKAFSAAEQFNRRITFIAAYKLARDKGMADPMAFAQKTIAETQGVYNKGNKPTWARGAIGGTLFTFKQYSISYVEFLQRMWGNGPEGKKAVGLALGVLFLSAGLGGMPGADDLDDVIDGFAQRVLGKSFDSKQAKKEFFASILGQAGAEFVMGGLTGLPGAPIDLSGRLGLGNLIPGTGIFTKKTDYGRDIAEIFGPAGSLFKQGAAGAAKLAQGDLTGAAKEVAPVAGQNVIKAVDMAVMGQYRDTKGRKVIDTDMWEAVAKGVGFQPTSVKRVQDATGTQQNLIGQNKLRETEIADKWAAGRIERNPGKVEEAKAELAEWNRKNPQSPISIDASQINRRVQQAMMEKAKRLEKTAPKEIRDSVKRELERASN